MGIIVLLLVLFHKLDITSAWNYRDQHLWVNEFPVCDPNGDGQSPLKLYEPREDFLSEFLSERLEYPRLQFGSGWFSNTFWKIDNNERFLIWDQYEAQSVPATLAGGPLGSEVYRIQEIEFHVGDNDNTGIKHSGSEHVINDLRYQGELQLVFVNVKYSSAEEALEHADGYAVIALLLKAAEESENGKIDKSSGTKGFRKFIRAAKRYAKAIARERTDKFLRKDKKAREILVDLKLGKFLTDTNDIRHYITYNGSFTSPIRQCKEAVTWIVYPIPIYVLETFLVEMRAPEGNNGNLKNNWRKDISSFSRKSFNNIPQAGYPKFVPDAGNDPDKVFRPWRFYRHEIRQVVQEAAQKSKGIEALDKTQANLEIDLTEARAKAALAVGTDYESETSEEVARLERTLEAVVGIQAERQAEEAELLAQVEEKKELLRQIVVARYQS